jgi:hypothetical protein
MKLIDIDTVRGKRDLALTLKSETVDIGIRDGEYTDVSGTNDAARPGTEK